MVEKATPESDVEEVNQEAIAPPWMTVLHNCDCHTFEQVVKQLQKAIGCSEAKGWELAWQVHNTGRAVVKVGAETECVRVGNILASIGLVVTAAPCDDLWHRLFGLDVTLWSPPHLLALFGSAISTLGCLLIAVELYSARSWAGRLALILAGAVLYGGVRVTLDPSWLYAYSYGGVLFHAFAMLAALILPLALVTTARVSALRWAPVLAVIVSFAAAIVGQEIAQAGFALIQPVSFLDEEVAKDAGSPIAVGREIAEKNRTVPPPPWALRLALPLIPAALMALADPRRRPRASAIVYGVGVFTEYAWFLSTLPAYAPLTPTGLETVTALLITVACAAASGLAARWLAAQLVGGTPEPRAGRARPVAGLTSPGR